MTAAFVSFPLPHRRNRLPSRSRPSRLRPHPTVSLDSPSSSSHPPPPSPPPSTPSSYPSHPSPISSLSTLSTTSTPPPVTPPPDWPSLSRHARRLLSTLPPPHPPAPHEAALATLLRSNPSNPFLWHALATHHASNSNLAAAHATLSSALRILQPGSRGALHHLAASLHLRAHDSRAAIATLATAARTDPYVPVFLLLARLHSRAGRADHARRAIRDGLSVFPRSTVLWRTRATLEATHGTSASALAATREALDQIPNTPAIWHLLVRFEQDAGAGAARLADVLYDALAACPEDAMLRLRLAKVEVKRKGPRVARDVLAPVAHGPYPDVLRFLGSLQFDASELTAARELFRRAVDLEASMPPARKPRARQADDSEYGGGQQDSGDESGPDGEGRRSRSKRTQGSNVKTLHAWALLEARIGNVDEARSLLAEARALCQTDPALWRALAELEARERNFDEARRAFQNALALDPNDPRIYLAWGRTETIAGDEKRAEALIAKIDTLPPNRRRALQGRWADRSASAARRKGSSVGAFFDVVPKNGDAGGEDHGAFTDGESSRTLSLTPHVLGAALRERAMLASRDGRFDDSVTLLTRASRVEPACETGWRLLASQEKRLQGMERLREVYKDGLEQVANRSKQSLLHWWGQDERSEGNIQGARELFRKATVANPDYMSAWMSWGLMEKSEGHVDEACDIFEQATRRAERDAVRAPFVFLAWGRLEELERGKADEAAKIFERGVRLAPSSGPLWTAWGLLEHRRANVAKGREIFRKATNVDPKHASAWHSWALLEARQCNFAKASELFRTGCDCDRNDASLLTSWAQMEGQELSDVTRARDLFDRAMKADENYVSGLLEWGNMEMNAGNLHLARDLFDKASRIRDCGAAPWVALGRLEWEHFQNGEAAVRMWRRGLEAVEGDIWTLETWAVMEGERGDVDAARKLLADAESKARGPVSRAQALLATARLEQTQGDVERAHKLVETALETDSKRGACWELAVDIARARDGLDAALQVARNGADVLRDSLHAAPLLVRCARLQAECGRLEKARELFGIAVRAHPARLATWEAFEDVEKRFGCSERASKVGHKRERMFNRRADAGDLTVLVD